MRAHYPIMAAGLLMAAQVNASVITLTVGSAAAPTLNAAANTANADPVEAVLQQAEILV
jgi:hypothetical protein